MVGCRRILVGGYRGMFGGEWGAGLELVGE